jgi:hypothetical protein
VVPHRIDWRIALTGRRRTQENSRERIPSKAGADKTAPSLNPCGQALILGFFMAEPWGKKTRRFFLKSMMPNVCKNHFSGRSRSAP